MTQLQAILKYQEVDRKLFTIEKEISGSEARKEYVKVKKFLEAAPEKLDALEAKSASLQATADRALKQYEQLAETLKDFENLDELVSSGADISFYKKNAQATLDRLKKLKAEINALIESIKTTGEEYQKLKKQVISLQKKYPEVKKAYEELKAAKAADKAPIEKELAELAVDISAELMTLYKTKRKEKGLPVVGQITGNRCPYCSMDLPLVARSKLSGGKWIECENHICSRILFE